MRGRCAVRAPDLISEARDHVGVACGRVREHHRKITTKVLRRARRRRIGRRPRRRKCRRARGAALPRRLKGSDTRASKESVERLEGRARRKCLVRKARHDRSPRVRIHVRGDQERIGPQATRHGMLAGSLALPLEK